MSSFSYLSVSSVFDPTSSSWENDALQIGGAKYVVPVLWLALLDVAGPRRLVDDDVVFATRREEGIARLRSRVARLSSWLTQADVAGYVEHFAALLEEEDDPWLVLDASEIAGMSKEGELVGAVDTVLAWLDGDDDADGPTRLLELSSLSATIVLPPPQAGLEDTCSYSEWENVLGLVGAGDGWWD